MDYKLLLSYLQPELDKVIFYIKESLKSDIDLLNQTNENFLSHRGKLIRPVLSLLIARACSGGNINDDTLRLAAAAELLHNATLFHDDVADNSPTRRGVPTVMSLLGGRVSVLLGDYWLVKAVENILNLENHRINAIEVFSKTLSNLAEGEMFQLQKASSCDTTEEDYFRIIYNKTSSLFVATSHAAALSVGATEEQVNAAIEFATNLGQAFQIKDDILDYNGEDIGKPLGQDLQEQKITMPLLGAFFNSTPDKEAEIRKMLLHIDENPEYQSQIVNFVKENKGVEYAEQKLLENIEAAKNSLMKLPSGKDRDYLLDLSYFVIGRNK